MILSQLVLVNINWVGVNRRGTGINKALSASASSAF